MCMLQCGMIGSCLNVTEDVAEFEDDGSRQAFIVSQGRCWLVWLCNQARYLLRRRKIHTSLESTFHLQISVVSKKDTVQSKTAAPVKLQTGQI